MPGKRSHWNYFQTIRIILFAIVAGLLLTRSPSVHAHKVYLYAWIEGDRVHTESYFSGGKKVRTGLIKVFDLSGNKILEGKTDEKGEFSFKITEKRGLRIVLDAAMGHRAEYILEVNEKPEAAVGSDKTSKNKESRIIQSPVFQVDTEHIKLLVEDVIDSRLKPIIKTLTKIQEDRGPGLTEIIGGIGYIFGLMGIILYIKSRKKH